MGSPTEPQWDCNRHPSLSKLFEGAPAGEFWCRANEPVLDCLEEIVGTVLAKKPPGFGKKLREFAAEANEQLPLNLRFELVIAARFIRYGIPFEFGGKGQPDFRCKIPSTGHTFLVEATTRTKNDVLKLIEEIEGCEDHIVGRAEIQIADRRLAIPLEARDRVRTQIWETLSRMKPNSSESVPLPELRGSAFCDRGPQDDSISVLLRPLSITDEFVDDIERELFNVLGKEAKRRQAMVGPTLLVVDVGRLGLAWTTPEGIWETIISRLLIPWDELPYEGIVITLTGLTSLTVRGYPFLRPGISALNCDAALQVLHALGIVRVLSGEECVSGDETA